MPPFTRQETTLKFIGGFLQGCYNTSPSRDLWNLHSTLGTFTLDGPRRDIALNYIKRRYELMKETLQKFQNQFGEGTAFDLDYGKLVILGLLIYMAFFKEYGV